MRLGKQHTFRGFHVNAGVMFAFTAMEGKRRRLPSAALAGKALINEKKSFILRFRLILLCCMDALFHFRLSCVTIAQHAIPTYSMVGKEFG